MPTELINLELDELSLVPKGANPMAKAPIFKANTLNGDTMTDKVEEVDKGAEEIATLTAEVAKMKLENERLRKGLLDAGYTISADDIAKAAPAEYVEYDGESINKADIPAPILKALEAAEVEKADNALTKRAEATLPHFDVATAKGLLAAVDKMDDTEILIAALEAADKAFADKMEEFGKSSNTGEFASPKDALDAMVASYKSDKGVDFHKAYAEVAKTDAGKALINKIYKDKE
jgi:hypothetical protein